jgi:hypothetical protein
VKRTTEDRLAEGDTAVHAAPALFPAFFLLQLRVKLPEAADTLQRLFRGILFSDVIQKTSYFTHPAYSFPSFIL